ncbi:autoinducer 2 (AI-2) kinase [Parafannyhessea umbonata]|uniref:Autoinducer 2 (AI-2) kinase n=2 Tax=Parafannyhessea umbonata TaxID=604330 RepID=A0A1H9PL37_9ACTN|nr:autoinducer 2 (AI-2) kinase [Parafannyhessea umbonata]
MVMSKYLMAIDAGTGSVRAVLFDTDGNQIGVAQTEWTHREDPRWPGSMDFDWKHNWDLASGCVREVLAKTGVDARDVRAVSTTCMREGILLYDVQGEVIWACANVDARSNDEVAELIQMNPELEREIYLESGQTYALGALPRLLWVKNKMPEIYEKCARVGMFNDWLIYKLTGVLAVEPSNGSTTGIMNLSNRDWDPSIAERCGIKSDIFPEVRECGEQIGVVNARGAEQTGLAEGTPVIVGGGDCQLGMIGIGACEPGQAGVFGGSFWQYEFNTDNGSTDPKCRVRVNCHAVPGVWQYEALAFKPGLVMRWFRDGFCQAEKEIARQEGRDVYDVMNERAREIPAGSHGMLCCFSDVMNFIHWTHAAPTFTNFELDPERFNKYTFFRAILENTAMLVLGHIDLVREATGNEPQELVFAGGASKSPLWAQILADVTGKPVKVPVVKEATALGAAILAGVGIGVYASVADGAAKVVKWDKTFVPNADNHETYRLLYQQWRTVYQAQLSLAEGKATKAMWSAPGI